MDTPFVVPVVLSLCLAAVLILRGPLGKALADRIAGRGQAVAGGDAERVLGEIEEIRHRLSEIEERVDFSERLLARGREAGRASPGG